MKNTTLGILCLLLLGFTLFQFCVKPPDYPDEPVIEFQSISKNTLRQSALPGPLDSVLVTLTFTDGDGDLGSEGNDFNIFIMDGRDSFPRDPYRLPYVAPQGTGNGISGDISIRLPSLCCIYTEPDGTKRACGSVPVQLDTLSYIIYIKDRAGHESNRIKTPPLTLICKE